MIERDENHLLSHIRIFLGKRKAFREAYFSERAYRPFLAIFSERSEGCNGSENPDIVLLFILFHFESNYIP